VFPEIYHHGSFKEEYPLDVVRKLWVVFGDFFQSGGVVGMDSLTNLIGSAGIFDVGDGLKKIGLRGGRWLGQGWS